MHVFLLAALAALAAGGFFSPAAASAADEPFTFPSNAGYTGLMEMPTARVMGEERWRAGVSYVKPLWYYYGTLSPLKGLEINARITKVEGYPALGPGFGDDKDKAVDIKYQFLPEGKYAPAMAIGFLDPHGTRQFGAQYLVASKQIYPFDFTIGFGDGRFGDRPLRRTEGFKFEILSDPGQWLSDGRFFYGIQFAPSERFALMAEYSPIDHDRQRWSSARDYFQRNPISSKFNLGLRWKPVHFATVDLSWQRGNRIGLGVSTEFDFGKPFIPIYDHRYREPPERSLDPLETRIVNALYLSGFRDIGVELRGRELWVDAENVTYFFTPRAIDVVLDLLARLVPEGVEDIHFILKENGIPVVHLNAIRNDILDLAAGTLTYNQFLYLSDFSTESRFVPEGEKRHRRYLDFDVKPAVRFFVNDPSGFLRYRMGVTATAKVRPRRGATLAAGVSTFPVNTVSTSNIAPQQAVRSDIVDYIDESAVLDRLMAEQIVKLPNGVHVKGAAGILEIQYAGLDGEIAMPVMDGRFLAGLSGSVVKKREPGEAFSTKKNPHQDYYRTAFVNTRLNIPEQDMWLDIKAGQFLAGDRGARFTVSKIYNGLTLSAWYGVTGTSMFLDNANRGYRDKGVSVSIPLRFLKGSDSKTTYGFAISPWTRDVAQDINHMTPLFDYIGRDVKILLDRDRTRR